MRTGRCDDYGDADQRPIEALLLTHFEIDAARAGGRRWNHDLREDLAGLEHIFASRVGFGQYEELIQRDDALALGSNQLCARTKRYQRGRKVRRMHDVRRAAAENRVIAVEALSGVTGVATFLEANDVGIAKVPASRPLQEIAADRREIANLRRGRFPRRLRQRGVMRAD